MKAHRQLYTVSLLLPASLVLASCSREDLSSSDSVGVASQEVAIAAEGTGVSIAAITDAPTGFDNLTNGFATQTDMDAAFDVFSNEVEFIDDGLGPVYNAQACRECHQNPVVGAGSQVSEFRAGHFNGVSFVDHPGGSLLNDRAIDPAIQERIAAGQEVRTFRLSLSIMGDGFVEAIDSNTLANISAAQPAGQRGQVIQVPVLEANGVLRAGRFGWKNQNSSLLSFAADAYLNEMGITSPLLPTENTSNGNSVAGFDTVADPEDSGADIAAFATFMRSLKAPSRDAAVAATTSAQRGSGLFDAIGCAVCHVRTINTAPAGTVINGGQLTVPPALGDKAIHPFGDFLLHDVGTGDGIVQNGGQSTRNKVRTAPLWGMRARDRLMHDGASVSRTDAILRHRNEAAGAANNFASLSTTSQNDVINFLNSL
ncbi:MAG TPA: di-heme oxidoredictase family protein [Kofleriaceae bacterium]|nr:di-heme oxidoredictase family protein [Kofleriaceae bacterium]